MGQSTNDMFPTAIHVAVGQAIHEGADPGAAAVPRACWRTRRKQWDDIIKIGRTHLADATPIRLGQEFSGYARQLGAVHRAGQAGAARRPRIARRRHGGRHRHQHASRSSAPRSPRCWPRKPASRSSRPRTISRPTPTATAWSNARGQLRAIAVSLFTVANNIRWLGSGPRCGFYEVMLPDRQPGSSIMPGKVNPVMCESMMQVCARVMGNDQTHRLLRRHRRPVRAEHHDAGDGPGRSWRAFELLASCTQAFVDFCAVEMEANRAACEKQVE